MSNYILPADCPYGVKSVKTFRGHDGMGYEATVTLNGKAVLVAVEEARGGELNYQVAKLPKTDAECIPAYHAMRDAVDALETYAKTLPDYTSEYFPEGLSMSGDLLVEELVNAALAKQDREKNRKRYAKFCATETLFRLKGDKKGSWRSLKGIGAGATAYLTQKYNGLLEAVLNPLLAVDPYAWERF